MKTLPALFLAFCLGAGLPCSALVRIAVVMGNNTGLPQEKPLSYATRDAEQTKARAAYCWTRTWAR